MRRDLLSIGIIMAILTVAIPVRLSAWNLADVVDGIVNGQSSNIEQEIWERMQRELAYRLLREALRESNIGGADYFVDALKYWVESRDGGRATGAFLKGLEKSGVSDARAVMHVLYSSAVVGRIASRQVSDDIQSFIDYMTPRLRSYRGVEELEKEKAPPEFSTPQGTWEIFLSGLRQGEWEPVARAMSGHIPGSVELQQMRNVDQAKHLQDLLKREKSMFEEASFNVTSTEKIGDAMQAFEINAISGKNKEHFWAVFEMRKEAWALVGILEDIALLRSSAREEESKEETEEPQE